MIKNIRKISIMLIIVFIIVGVNSLSFASSYGVTEMLDVNIYIDGIEFQADQEFYSYQGSTLVPMRALFEKLGAEIEWIQETQTIIAKTSDSLIELGIDKKTAKKDGKNIDLAVEAKLINKVTYAQCPMEVARGLNQNHNLDRIFISERKHQKAYQLMICLL